jgi:hypothetical protein
MIHMYHTQIYPSFAKCRLYVYHKCDSASMYITDNIVFFLLPVSRASRAISISRSASFLRARTHSNTHTHTCMQKSAK